MPKGRIQPFRVVPVQGSLMFDLSKFRSHRLIKKTAAAMLLSSAQAAPIIVPTGLNPGDTYRLVFVTSTGRDGTSSNIADYNAFVTASANSQAALAALEMVSLMRSGQ